MLEDKIGLVTGAGQGIGRAIAVEMARQGAAAVAVADLNLEGAEETAALIRDAGGEAQAIEVNLRDRDQIEAMVAQVADSFGGLDTLFNNAGIIETSLTEDTAVDTLPEAAWDAVYEVNLRAVWLTTKFAAPHLRRSTRGPAIVNTASVSGLTGFSHGPVYCTTKGGVIQLTKVTAVDLAPIRCNCFAPGVIETPSEPRVHGHRRGSGGTRALDARPSVAQPDGAARGSGKARLLPGLRRCRLHHRRGVPDRRWRARLDGRAARVVGPARACAPPFCPRS